MATLSDEDVVAHRDIQQAPSLNNTDRQRDIGTRRRRIPRRMIVHKDDRNRVVSHGISKQLADPHGRLIGASLIDRPHGESDVLAIHLSNLSS